MGSYEENLKRIRENRKKKEEEDKLQSSSASRSSAYEENLERIRKNRMSSAAGADSIGEDYMSLADRYNTAYNTWQSPENMSSLIADTRNMQKRIGAYKNYVNSYDPRDNMDSFNKNIDQNAADLEKISSSLDTLKNLYGAYKDENSFNVAKEKEGYKNKYKGKSFDEIQSALKDMAADSSEADYLRNYTDYENLNDYDKAISATDDKKLKERLSSIKREKELDDFASSFADVANNADYEEGVNSNKWTVTKGLDETKFITDVEVSNGKQTYKLWDLEKLGYDVTKLKDLKKGESAALINPLNKSLDFMDEDEKNNYAYIVNTKGLDEAKKYKEKLQITNDKRKTEDMQEKVSSFVDESGVIGQTLFSLGTPVLSQFGGMLSFGKNVVDKVTGKEINPYDSWHTLSNYNEAIRDTVRNNIAEASGGSVLPFLYDTGLSIEESLLGAATFGQGFSLIMGTNAAQDRAKELKEQGASEKEIVMGSMASGIAEALFEEVSLDKLIHTKHADSIRELAKNVIKQAGVEASEEMATELANTITDTIIRTDESDFNKAMEVYKNFGLTDEEALEQATKDVYMNIGLAGLGGAISGGVSGGAASFIDFGDNAKTGAELSNKKPMLTKIADKFSAESQTRKLSEKYTKQGKTAENLTDREAGALYKTALEESYFSSNEEDRRLRAEVNSLVDTKVRSTGESVSIKGISEKNGDTYVETDKGSYKLDDLDVNTNYEELIHDAEGMEQDKANTYLSNYDGVTNPEQYTAAFELTYAKGLTGTYTAEEAVDSVKSILDERTALLIFKDAYTKTAKETKISQDMINSLKSEYASADGSYKVDDSVISYKEGDGGVVPFKSLTANQKVQIAFAHALAKDLNANVELFSSRHGGAYANGYVDENTNTIYLDVFAEQKDGNLTNGIMTAASHELVHWSKNKSPELYASLKEIVKQSLTADGKNTLSELVAAEMERMQKAHPNSNVDEESAMDELIARSCEDLLSNSKTGKQIAESLSDKDKVTFFEHVKEFIGKVIDAINNLLGKYDSQSKEAVILRNNKELFDKALQTYDAMLKDAAKASGAISGSNNIKHSDKSSVMVDSNGKEYVVINENTFSKNQIRNKDKLKTIQSIIENELLKLKGKSVEVEKNGNPHILYFDEAFADEYTHAKTNDRERTIKYNVAFDIEDIIKTSKFLNHSSDKKNHIKADASRGFDYYELYFAIQERETFVEYSGVLNVRMDKNGKDYCYELKPIKKVGLVALIQKVKTIPTTDKISDSEPNVKYSDKEVDAKYNELIKSGDMNKLQEYVNDYAEFKLEKSKARNEKGKLREFYHGTNAEEFNVFDMSYLGSGSGDSGFFGKGFYFAFNRSEARFYGNSIKNAFLDARKPYYVRDLYDYDGKEPSNYYASNAVFCMNFAKEFPELSKEAAVYVYDGADPSIPRQISLEEYTRAFDDVYKNVKFETVKEHDDYDNEDYYVTRAGKETKSYKYEDGTEDTWEEYSYEKKYTNEKDAKNKIDNAYSYLEEVIYKDVTLPKSRLFMMDTDFAEAVKDKGYDSIFQSKTGDEAVVFDSSQIKDSSPITYDDNGNIIPLSQRFDTSKKDIRYSDKIKKELDGTETAERTKDLVAIHNLSEEKLRKTFELGGFPMPSIAVTKAELGHTNFGGISLVFGSDTIDPKNKANKIYPADAWTPTFPRIEYEANYESARKAEDEIYKVTEEIPDTYKNGARSLVSGLHYNLTDYGGKDGVIDRCLNSTDMKAAFLSSIGEKVEEITKETRTEFSDDEKALSKLVIDAIGEEALNTPGLTGTDILERYGDILSEVLVKNAERKGLDGEDAKKAVNGKMGKLAKVRAFRNARNFLTNGGVTIETSVDYAAMREGIERKVNTAEYLKWLNDLFGDIEDKKGLYNGKDIFTASGNRRSFEATHYPVTVENIVRAMIAQAEGNVRNVSGFNGTHSIRASLTDEFKSLDDIRKAEGKLKTIDSVEYEEMNKKLQDRLYTVISDIRDSSKAKGSGNPFIDADIIGENILETKGKMDAAAVQKAFKGTLWVVSDENAAEIADIIAEIREMPVNMFEAKPLRVVGFDEVKYAVLPDNASEEIKDLINNNGIPIIEYAAGHDEERIAKINNLSDVKFSDKYYMSSTGKEISSEFYDVLGKLHNKEMPSLETIYSIPEVAEGVRRTKGRKATIDIPGREKSYREKVDKLIVNNGFADADDKVYNGDAEVGYRADLVLGLPASGKSSVITNRLLKENRAFLLDSDEAKKTIDEFDKGWGADIVHEESKAIMEMLNLEVMAEGYNLVMPIVGSKESKVLNKIENLKKMGYEVNIHLVEVDQTTSLERLLKRFISDNRFLNPKLVYEYGRKPSDVYEKVKEKANEYSKWSNEVEWGERPILIEEKNGRSDIRGSMAERGSNRGSKLEDSSGKSASEEKKKEISFSDKYTDVNDILEQNANLKKRLKAFEKDVARLNERKRILEERAKLSGKVTEGKILNPEKIALVAKEIKRYANSSISNSKLESMLNDLYSYMNENGATSSAVLWDKVTEVAREVMKDYKGEKQINDQAKNILRTIRETPVRLSDTQKAELQNTYGSSWRNALRGKLKTSEEGTTLDSLYNEWAYSEEGRRPGMLAGILNAEASEGDQILNLLDAIANLKEQSEIINKYYDDEMIEDLALNIYVKQSHVSPIETIADKYDKQIKQFNFEHRQAMADLRAELQKEIEEQKLADAMHFGKIYEKIRQKSEAEVKEAKEAGKRQATALKERVAKKAEIEKITALAKTLGKWYTDNSKKNHIPDAMKGSVSDLLRVIDFSSKQLLGMQGKYENRFSPTQADMKLSDALDNVRRNVKSASINEDGESTSSSIVFFPDGFEEELDQFVQTIRGIENRYEGKENILNQMSLEELTTLKTDLKIVKTVITNANKALASRQKLEISNIAQQFMVEANQIKDEAIDNQLTKFFNYQNALPYYVFKRWGKAAMGLFEGFQDGQDKFAFNIKEIEEFAKTAYKDEEVSEWQKEIHEFELFKPQKEWEQYQKIAPEKVKVKMTTAQIMSLYLLAKREQAQGHMFKGGIRIEDFKDSALHVLKQTDGLNVSEDDVKRITDTLTDRQKEVADTLQKFMAGRCSEWGNEVTMKLMAIRKFTEEHYFPITSDSNSLGTAEVKDRSSSINRLLNMSFTKDLVAGANNQILIRNVFDVFAEHSSDMAKYNALALPVLDVIKWYNYKEKESISNGTYITTSVMKSLERAYGRAGKTYLTTFLKDINSDYDGGRDETFMKQMMGRYKMAAVGGNIRVALLQPTAYARAAAVMSPKYLAEGFAHKPSIQKAQDNSGIALWKAMGFYDTDVSRGVKTLIKHDETLSQKIADKTLTMAEWGDKITWGFLWNACEAEIKDTTKLDPKSEEFTKAVSDRFREIIYSTQVVDSIFTRSQIMRGKGAGEQMLTAFMSEPTVSYNMLLDAYSEWNKDARSNGGYMKTLSKHGRDFGRKVAVHLIVSMLVGLSAGLWDWRRDPKNEDEAFMQKAWAAFFDQANPLTMLPILKEIPSFMQGFDSARMDTSWIQTTVSASQKIVKDVGEKNVNYKTIYTALKAASQATGMPMSNTMRDTVAMWNSTLGELYPTLYIDTNAKKSKKK